ncbi:MAG: hypothetical protein OIF40_06280 [Mangrovicoccus sp.]|nr:hypothetical protein [Mangrovicoccus sp.]
MNRLSPPRSRLALTLMTSCICAIAPGLAFAQDAERIAALEAQLEALMSEMESLKQDLAQTQQIAETANDQANRAVLATPGGQSLGPDQIPASSPVVRMPGGPGIDGQPFYPANDGRTTGVLATGNDLVRLTFSGQLHKAVNIANDGVDTTAMVVDNENASTRFRFLGETDPYKDWQAVTLFEFEWPANGSLDANQIDQQANRSGGVGDLNLRLSEVGISNNAFGSFFIGQGWMASDGTAEIDLSGHTSPIWSGQTFSIGGLLATQDTVPGAPTDYVSRNPGLAPEDPNDPYYDTASNFVNIFSLGQNLDGLSRLNRIRYNTPVWSGVQFSTSVANEDQWDAALRYGVSGDWGKFAAAVSYWGKQRASGFDAYTGSASLRLASGLSFTVSGAQQKHRNGSGLSNTPTTWFGKIAYDTKLNSLGNTSFGIMYANYDEFRVENENMQLYGIGIQQNIDRFAAEAYLAFNYADIDSGDPFLRYNDLTVLTAGTRVRF